MIRNKIVWAAILGIALVGVAIGALVIRSARNDAATPAATAENPAPANEQANPTADQTAVDKASAPETAKNASNGPTTRRYGRRSVYYNYSDERHGRTFWQKHRDKLTVAAGAGTGALVGGLIGGKKGAGIGLLGGGAGSALYTYKLRHRRHRY
jgi:hypothetical protein